MQSLEISGAVRPIYGSLGVKRLRGRSHGVLIYTAIYEALSFCTVELFLERLLEVFHNYGNLLTSCQLRGFCDFERYRCKGGEVKCSYEKEVVSCFGIPSLDGRN